MSEIFNTDFWLILATCCVVLPGVIGWYRYEMRHRL